jgi:SAM-dependent methyltransferase
MVSQQKQTIDTILDQQLGEITARLRPQKLLLIGVGLDDLSRDCLNSTTLLVCVDSKGDTAEGSLVCRTRSLPFMDDVFDVAVVYHLLGDGLEPELQEAGRVIRPGGQLLVIGTGRFSGTRKKHGREQPSMKVQSIIRQMRSLDFDIRKCQGIGLRGRSLRLDARWQMPLLTFSNLILIRGRHQGNHPMVTPLRFSRSGKGSVGLPALDSLSREVAR